MNHPDEELRKAVALFRYGLIADVLRVPLGSREIRRALHEKAQRTYTIPGTRRTRVAVETMRDWLSLYRTGGFEALYPKTRADRGQPRRLPPEVAELARCAQDRAARTLGQCPDWRRTQARRRSPPRPLHRAPPARARGPARQTPPATTGNVLDMYKSIAWELGLPTERSRATAYRAIRAEITRRVCEAKQLPILVIDEAQHLRNDVLEDLRLLTNFAMDSENRLCLLLVGLTELRRRLPMAVHESLSQRLIVRHHLNGLDRDELDHYLTHRLRLAGCELPLFEPPAVEALFQSTRGLPRLINRIAHYALTAAALNNARTVTAEHLEHAVAELRL